MRRGDIKVDKTSGGRVHRVEVPKSSVFRPKYWFNVLSVGGHDYLDGGRLSMTSHRHLPDIRWMFARH